jgi:peptidoglycan-N-acetylglucosamine deacetylase
MLGSAGMRGTFYVPLRPYRAKTNALDALALRALSAQGFEIGAHSVSHKNLAQLSGEGLAAEVDPCKQVLEDIISKPVPMFCYPGGRYNREVLRALKNAGYRGARTVRMLATSLKFEPFEMAVTLQAYPHPLLSYMKNVGRSRRLDCLKNGWAKRKALSKWSELGKRLFDDVLLHGGTWHLYGHSWEIEQLDLWDELKDLLEYVGRRENVTYLCNGDLLKTA